MIINYAEAEENSPERREETFSCNKGNKEFNTLKRLQVHKEWPHAKPNRQKRVLGPSKALGSMRRTVV